jgi:hypothetical protein
MLVPTGALEPVPYPPADAKGGLEMLKINF